ncbi:putative metal-binding protein [Sporomusaceae bacterium BoRhaA]|uniref:CGGC domain-containing protein n=1 Tax=Pelorhabdus rhamnosifermentans TaxID=2772457 RepID=UPI001C061D40|nr:CGGC domain-containing protein [Pelorhabdus rhamnosifermentans]MBU2700398.1 putative metal-binding protein [Pelorhabdus rhamnosifermentans]
MKIAILVREETMQRCTGRGCLNAFFQRKDAFGRYEGKIELVTFSHAGGDIDHKIETMIKNGVDVVHLSSCMRGKASNYETLAKRLGEHFYVVGYTHGAENGKRKDTIFSLAPRGIAEQISVKEDKEIY